MNEISSCSLLITRASLGIVLLSPLIWVTQSAISQFKTLRDPILSVLRLFRQLHFPSSISGSLMLPQFQVNIASVNLCFSNLTSRTGKTTPSDSSVIAGESCFFLQQHPLSHASERQTVTPSTSVARASLEEAMAKEKPAPRNGFKKNHLSVRKNSVEREFFFLSFFLPAQHIYFISKHVLLLMEAGRLVADRWQSWSSRQMQQQPA